MPDDTTAPVTAEGLREQMEATMRVALVTWSEGAQHEHLAKVALSVTQEHAASQAAEVERLRAELAEVKAERDTNFSLVGRLSTGGFACATQLELMTDERDALKAAIADVRRLCDMTIATSCRVQAIDQATDTLAVLDRALPAPETTPDAPTACRRCEGSMVEPGTETEGDWDSAAMRHHPYTGEPCTACNGTGKATPELPGDVEEATDD